MMVLEDYQDIKDKIQRIKEEVKDAENADLLARNTLDAAKLVSSLK